MNVDRGGAGRPPSSTRAEIRACRWRARGCSGAEPPRRRPRIGRARRAASARRRSAPPPYGHEHGDHVPPPIDSPFSSGIVSALHFQILRPQSFRTLARALTAPAATATTSPDDHCTTSRALAPRSLCSILVLFALATSVGAITPARKRARDRARLRRADARTVAELMQKGELPPWKLAEQGTARYDQPAESPVAWAALNSA